MNFKNIKQAIADIKSGKIIIVTDDVERENEGQLMFFVVTNETHEGVLALVYQVSILEHFSLNYLLQAFNGVWVISLTNLLFFDFNLFVS